jgi:hypothetical protein
MRQPLQAGLAMELVTTGLLLVCYWCRLLSGWRSLLRHGRAARCIICSGPSSARVPDLLKR